MVILHIVRMSTQDTMLLLWSPRKMKTSLLKMMELTSHLMRMILSKWTYEEEGESMIVIRMLMTPRQGGSLATHLPNTVYRQQHTIIRSLT